MHKTINCGKIDWNKTGRKCNAVELELALNLKNGHYVFSCSGAIWNSRHTNWVAGGQCYDELSKFAEMSKYQELLSLWKKYSRNDLRAGSPKQEEAVAKWRASRKPGERYDDYPEACAMLKKKGLLEDKSYMYEGKPYRYGTAWLVQDIPEEDLEKIRKWM